MRADYPEVFLKLGKHSSASILAKVEKGELDFGIIRVSQRKNLDVKSIELGREKILLALPASHRLAKKSGAVEMSELKNEKFAMLPYEESPFFRRTIDEAPAARRNTHAERRRGNLQFSTPFCACFRTPTS